MDKNSFALKWGISTMSVFVVLALWYYVTARGYISPIVLPSPGSIYAALVEYDDLIVTNFVSTLVTSAVGFSSAVLLGLTFGIVFALNDWVYDTFMPIMVSVNSVPRVALAPIILFYIGGGDLARYVISAWVAFFPMFINVVEGLDAVDESEIYLCESVGATTWQIFRKVRFWNSLPHVFDGLKICITLAIIGAIVGEFVQAQEGIGFIVLFTLSSLQINIVFAAVGLMALVSLTLVLMMFVLEQTVIFWRDSELLS